ncbi:MAG: AEC family transporter [Lachnospiraceae bacterium]|nr:AEC family transporter [Lachnospiraceae bacterium]
MNFNPVFYRPISFFLIICAGYLLKKKGFFGKTDYKVISKMVLNITLPAAVICTFAGFERDLSLFVIVFLGFLCSLIPMLAVYMVSGKEEKHRRIFSMINTSGYAIGSFTLPLVQGFFGAYGGVITCMFDTGNAVMMTGGSYALTTTLLKVDTGENNRGKGQWLEILKKFITSVPFDTYMLMLILSACNIRIPEAVASLAAPISASNPYLAMMVVGMMYEPAKDASYRKDTLVVILRRLVFASIFALLLYYGTPFPLEVRRVLAVVVFSPVSTLAPIYTERCHGDGSLSSYANAISIILSLLIISVLVYFMGVS